IQYNDDKHLLGLLTGRYPGCVAATILNVVEYDEQPNEQGEEELQYKTT
ncbi:15926_t:CDS:2, partial [Entrophospora sp. SA101]